MSSRGWLLVLIAASVLCAGVALLSVAAAVVWYSQRDVPAAVVYPTWRDPTNIEKLKIDAVQSISTLAGGGDARAINQMLTQGAVDSAYAATVYSTELSDRQRLAQLLYVGERYVALQQAEQARLTYQVLMDVAALSPDLSDFERADALAQAAGGLYTLRDRNLARLALDAGRDVARNGPFLKAASRFALLGRLLQAAQKGNDRERVQLLNNDRSGYVDQDSAAGGATEGRDPLPAIEPMRKDAGLSAAERRRVEAARKITATLDAGKAVPDDLMVALGDALFAEDEEYKRALATNPAQATLAQKLSQAQARLNWLTLKYRIGRGAFGTGIVEEWQDKVPPATTSSPDFEAIRTELTKAYEAMSSVRAEQAAALPRAQDVELAESLIVRRLLLAGRLGHYPNFPEDTLIERLSNLTEDLINNQPGSGLRVKVEGASGNHYFHLTSDDGWYGLPDKASPSARQTPAKGASPTRRPAATSAGAPATTPAPSRATALPSGLPPAGPAANTPVPAQPTNPPVPAQPTNTPVPAQPTSTAVPPQPTNTPAPVPATATPTRSAYP